MIRASIDFLSFSHLDLENHTNIVILKLTGNSVFPDLPFSEADLATANHDHTVAFTAWEVERGKTEHDVLVAAHKNLCSKLVSDADYVTLIAQGDAEKINSSGFHATSGRSSSTGDNYYVKVSNNAGEVTLFYAKEEDEVSTVWLVAKMKTPPSDDDYRYFMSTNCNLFVKSGLVSGDCCWFKAVGVKRGRDESNEVFMPAIMKFIP